MIANITATIIDIQKSGLSTGVVYTLPMDWFRGAVIDVRPAATGCFHLALEAPEPVKAAYAIPGQFVRLKPKVTPEGMFALAHAPGSKGPLEFLIKRGTPIADELQALRPGDALEVSAAQGKGFPVDQARGHNLLMVATGTGLAPMRAVIEHVRGERAAWKQVTLLFGAFTPAHFPWADAFAAWERDGVAVKTIVSDATPGWSGPVGFVQRLVETAPLEDTVALLVGQREMVAEVRGLLTSRGLSNDHVHLNF
jgi:sulfhydrogenase subunit gamma (sulfur reductase)